MLKEGPVLMKGPMLKGGGVVQPWGIPNFSEQTIFFTYCMFRNNEKYNIKYLTTGHILDLYLQVKFIFL